MSDPRMDVMDIPREEMTPREFALWHKCRDLQMELRRVRHRPLMCDDEPIAIHHPHLNMRIVAMIEATQIINGHVMVLITSAHDDQIMKAGIAIEDHEVKGLSRDMIGSYMSMLWQRMLSRIIDHVYTEVNK